MGVREGSCPLDLPLILSMYNNVPSCVFITAYLRYHKGSTKIYSHELQAIKICKQDEQSQTVRMMFHPMN